MTSTTSQSSPTASRTSRSSRRPTAAGRLVAFVRRPAVGALAVAVVVAGGGTAAANDWFQVFGAEQLAPVDLRADDLVALPDLRGLGELRLTGDTGLREVPSAEAAALETGLDVPTVADLPDGVTDEPAYQVAGPVGAVLTFDADTVAAAGLPALPEDLDGGRVRLDAGPGVAQIWTAPSGPPRLVVGRARAPVVSTDDADLAALRDYLLSMPGVPTDLAAQLGELEPGSGILPLPVPTGLVTSSTAEVAGVPATVLETPDGALAAVVWVDEGVVTVVAGSFGADEVLALARGLR